ncbi:MAG: AAA family ATPase [Limnospira sp.]
MATEKLIIKNFAGLNHIDIEIKKINILIGPQASGKSMIAKILFYCKGLIDEIFANGINGKTQRELDLELKNKFEDYFPVDSWRNTNFCIRYSIGEDYIEIKQSGKSPKKSGLSINYSDFYRESFDKITRISKRINENITERGTTSKIFSRFDLILESQQLFVDEVSDQLGSQYSFYQLFIPAGRSFFAHLQNNIYRLLSENYRIDPFLLDFGDYYETVKNSLTKIDQIKTEEDENYQTINTIKNRILLGKYIQINGKDYLRMNDGRQVQLSNCSSGQQEALPLTMILESLPFLGRSLTGYSVYIEEPEAHLFPTAQKDVVDLMATVYNFNPDKIQFFITTHSPYILTSFNNLLQAGILAGYSSEEKLKEITDIVPESCFLSPDEVTVYSLSDGTCESIMSAETGLIDAEIIDSVSENLAIQFDQLLDLE